jgi:hypothetical protein
LLPGMYITSNGVDAGYIANIVSNVILMVNSRGTITANLATTAQLFQVSVVISTHHLRLLLKLVNMSAESAYRLKPLS